MPRSVIAAEKQRKNRRNCAIAFTVGFTALTAIFGVLAHESSDPNSKYLARAAIVSGLLCFAFALSIGCFTEKRTINSSGPFPDA